MNTLLLFSRAAGRALVDSGADAPSSIVGVSDFGLAGKTDQGLIMRHVRPLDLCLNGTAA